MKGKFVKKTGTATKKGVMRKRVAPRKSRGTKYA